MGASLIECLVRSILKLWDADTSGLLAGGITTLLLYKNGGRLAGKQMQCAILRFRMQPLIDAPQKSYFAGESIINNN